MIELTSFYAEIKNILQQARSKAQTAVNSAMVEAYWLIGKRIVEEEQQGEIRAQYGKKVLKSLAKSLASEFGKGLDERELRRLRQFYLCFPIWDTVRPELSWSHYRLLIRVSNEKARFYYLTEAAEQHWSYRTLERNYKTLYHERLLSSQQPEPIKIEMQEKTAQKIMRQDVGTASDELRILQLGWMLFLKIFSDKEPEIIQSEKPRALLV
jgi:hypothetical protein